MHRYVLATEWVLAAPIERVWEALVEAESWPRWWRYVEDVSLLTPGEADGIGAIRRFTWSTPLAYRLIFDMTTTRISVPTMLDATASGELQGTGRWRLQREGANTCVVYAWRVVAHKRWLNACAWLLAPLFVWSHDRVMAAGARGLARRLGVPLLAQRRLKETRCTTC